MGVDPVMLFAMVETQAFVSSSLAEDKAVDSWVGVGQRQEYAWAALVEMVRNIEVVDLSHLVKVSDLGTVKDELVALARFESD